MKNIFKKINPKKHYLRGKQIFENADYIDGKKKNTIELEKEKVLKRTEIINFLLSIKNEETTYLEIGVRNPNDNFNHIKANKKYSVDPGVEFKDNPVDFKITSDEFFKKISNNEILSNDLKFDVIFIDGLHLAEQVDKDIENSLKYIKEDGFIVLHDCNPPTEWHARESYKFEHSPASTFWNGTTWKAFQKWRFNSDVYSCCIDTDWGVGIISKTHKIGNSIAPINPFFEYYILNNNRKESLNLIDFDTLKKMINK